MAEIVVRLVAGDDQEKSFFLSREFASDVARLSGVVSRAPPAAAPEPGQRGDPITLGAYRRSFRRGAHGPGEHDWLRSKKSGTDWFAMRTGKTSISSTFLHRLASTNPIRLQLSIHLVRHLNASSAMMSLAF
jgi:hypothetical protein